MWNSPGHLAAIGVVLIVLSCTIAAGARTVVDNWPAIRAALFGEPRP